MKKIKFSVLLSIFILSGCQDFLDVNDDIDSPFTSSPDLLMPAPLGNLATLMFDHGEVESYFTQHLATYSGFNKYKDRWDWVTANRVGTWRRHYHDISVNVLHMIESAEREGSTNYIGVGKIMYAFSSLTTTDVFGNMPFFDALRGIPSSPYDEQEIIYQEIIKLLDDGIEILENTDPTQVRPITVSQDLVFEGNLDHWIRFAYAVKARALLHLTPNVNSNYTDVITAVDNALSGWKDAQYQYPMGDASTTSPYQMNQWGESQADPSWDYGNNILPSSAPSEFFLVSALGYDPNNHIVSDPRQPLLFEPNEDGEYLSIVPGNGKIAIIDDDQYPNMFGSYMTQDFAPMPFIVEEELHFIKSEAAFQSGDLTTAYNSFLDGIERHMQRVGVEANDIASYLASDLVPQSSNELTLSHIMTQKYIAMYLQGETWVDMRRHDYNDQIYKGLERPTNLIFYWDSEDPNEWIERLPYDTETEEIYNKPELDKLGAYQNPEWLKQPMFWAK